MGLTTFADIKQKYSNYINYYNLISIIKPHIYTQNLIYDANTSQYGGSTTRTKNVQAINKVLTQFKKYNIQMDTMELKDNEITINLFTINGQLICFILTLDYGRKVGTITNLSYDADCLPDLDPKQVTNHMIAIIKEISVQAGMTRIELSDAAKFRCPINSKFELDLKYANTLTSGEPYYYKFGFKFDDVTTNHHSHANVKYNKKLLSKLKTSDLKISKFLKICSNAMTKLKFDANTTNQVTNFINKTWSDYSENPLIDFLNEIKYGICVLFSSIYMEIFEMLGLKPYTNNLMFLTLN